MRVGAAAHGAADNHEDAAFYAVDVGAARCAGTRRHETKDTCRRDRGGHALRPRIRGVWTHGGWAGPKALETGDGVRDHRSRVGSSCRRRQRVRSPLLAGATADEALSGLAEVVESGSDDLREVAESYLAQTNAFKDADKDRLLHHPSGEIDFDTFVRIRLGELVVHGWDLASAVGHAPALDAVVVSALWFRVQGHVDAMRSMGVYGLGATGERAQDAATEERLLDAFGRRSRG